MTNQDLIAARRDGIRQTEAELRELVRRTVSGEMPDYQVAAWLMAAYLNPLVPEETAALTLAMAESGRRLDLSGLSKPWLDKHSTGGVGDKTTLVVLPILAACGVTVVKMSGRGLGITGGTIDKLESIPGFRLDLTPTELVEQAKRIGIALTGAGPALAPADKQIYALRDATATVASIPLITSSILSKKIAGGAEAVVLDVKVGSGAFMPDLESAGKLAEMLCDVGTRAGLRVAAMITDMDQPLGRACGNAIEVAEAIATLRYDHQTGFADLCVELAGLALATAGVAATREDGRSQARTALDSGEAFVKACEWFTAQGADPAFCGDPDRFLPAAPIARKVFTHRDGWCRRFDARKIGDAVVRLGGGRQKKEDPIDHSVGISVYIGVGEELTDNELIATVFARNEEEAEMAAESVQEALEVSETPVEQPPSILRVLA